MGAQRPLIVPWLMEQLDAQRYPGVSWLNPERTRFRVPWKHGSRQSICSEDFQLFEDWAIARGRYRPGIDQRTPSEWKRNFRAALDRKDGIDVIQDNSTDSEDPHKVFEIKQPNNADLGDAAGGAVNTAADEGSSIATGSAAAYGDFSLSSQDKTLESVLSDLDLSSSLEALALEAENPNWCGILPPTDLDPTLSGAVGPPFEPVSETNAFVVAAENPVCSDSMSLPSLNLINPIVMAQPLAQILDAQTLVTDFEVRTYYRGRQVNKHMFSSVRGLCFVPPGCSGYYPDLADVVFPDVANLTDQIQASYTKRLIQKVAPGVLLCFDGHLLCGMRRGPCHVYWSQSEFPADGMLHGELQKEQLSTIYTLQQFVHELIGFMEGRNNSPNYTIWLCFGEEWPDTERPWKKKLVMVETCHRP
ncbi:interferon regulatory factor 3 isoform X2 [Sceloporus undulatus]|uniref:interferon regulatory factor 3 isoform X2 n=1 Tax=Sceloporus undulatus TaxID=8520 RepID=UPI001C4B92B6|nr:interferon regulatory factor 3 isoform X2 [Sceloporus undulatus]